MNKFMKNISSIARCAILYREENLKETGLTGYQFPYVLEINRNPGITQEQIANNLHVNPSTVTRQLSLMEKNGFIKRKRSEKDKRIMEVYITEKMEGLLPEVYKVFNDWRNLLTEGLTEEEMKILETLLERLARQGEELL